MRVGKTFPTEIASILTAIIFQTFFVNVNTFHLHLAINKLFIFLEDTQNVVTVTASPCTTYYIHEILERELHSVCAGRKLTGQPRLFVL